MALLTAYLDESGTHADSSVVIVGGALAKRSSWLSLTPQWNAVLKRAGVPECHASPFNSSKGPFLGWDRDRKKDLVIKLTRVMNKELSLIIAHGVRVEDFNAIKRDFPDVQLTAYQLCAEKCVAAITNWAQRLKRIAPVAIIFEAGQNLETQTMQTYKEAMQYAWLQEKYKIESVSIWPKKDVPSLQVADFVAYEAYKYHTTQRSEMLENLRPSLRVILEKTKAIGYFDTPALIRFWLETARQNKDYLAKLQASESVFERT
jgi:hypothetical protein